MITAKTIYVFVVYTLALYLLQVRSDFYNILTFLHTKDINELSVSIIVATAAAKVFIKEQYIDRNLL